MADDPTGSNTAAGMTNYDDLYADTREWIRQGYIDYIAPQIYWSIGFAPASYDILVDWWKMKSAIAPFIYTLDKQPINQSNSDPAWSDPEEYPRQIALNRASNVMGSIHFSLKDLNRNPLGIKDRLIQDLYKNRQLFPICLGLAA
ncbi:family 10 glycosylhydrolase [Bacillus licheniformis]|nr:family 10 glycosylhydrolase [Bacillus licheniformis]